MFTMWFLQQLDDISEIKQLVLIHINMTLFIALVFVVWDMNVLLFITSMMSSTCVKC